MKQPPDWASDEDMATLGSLMSPNLELEAKVQGEIMITWAGVLAEEYFVEGDDVDAQDELTRGFGWLKIPGKDTYIAPGGGDGATLISFSTNLCGGDTEMASALMEYLRIKVARFVRRDLVWERIEAVAKALLDRETLTFSECKAASEAPMDARIAEKQAGWPPREKT